MSGQADCATASAEIGRGLRIVGDAVCDVKEIVSAIHEALSKDPPKSKIPEALAELTARIDALTTEVHALRAAMERGPAPDNTCLSG